MPAFGRPASTLISTHAPRTGSDKSARFCRANVVDFNPRSPHGERQLRVRRDHVLYDISTHAPRTGSDIFRF